MAQERDELLDHDYDGIREFDNPLPRWWLWLFYGTILFAIVYIPYYLLGFGPTEAQMYQQEMAEARAEYPQQAATAPATAAPGTPAGEATAPGIANPAVVGNPQAIAAGKAIFLANCKPCHGEHGQGIIGPNLTDNYWLHGNRFQDIVHTIYNGVQDKGMIAWKSTLSPEKINEVAAYVMSIHGTHPANPKPPQGKEYQY